MNFWEKLKREIGNPLTTVFAHRGQIREETNILRAVNDYFNIDYGMDYMDFNFAGNGYNIYKLINKDGEILYENPRALNYYDTFKSFDDIIDERYNLFGDDFLKASINLKNAYVYNYIKYSKSFQDKFKKAITDTKNNLSYWYPKVKDIGFKTPKTETFSLSENIVNALIKTIESKNTDENSYDEYQNALLNMIIANTSFNFSEKLFIKSGTFSNKFNFESCTIKDFSELPSKFYEIFARELKVARGFPATEIVLREFIETSNNRHTIYNGMPLNTEFRVFYDFDSKKVLGIENYWNPEEMENGLRLNQDINNYLDEKNNINDEFDKLKDDLKKKCKKLEKVSLDDIWSVDFMWTGSEFVLIDMALAQCSFGWEKYQHLTNDGIKLEDVSINDGIFPQRVRQLIEENGLLKSEENLENSNEICK